MTHSLLVGVLVAALCGCGGSSGPGAGTFGALTGEWEILTTSSGIRSVTATFSGTSLSGSFVRKPPYYCPSGECRCGWEIIAELQGDAITGAHYELRSTDSNCTVITSKELYQRISLRRTSTAASNFGQLGGTWLQDSGKGQGLLQISGSQLSGSIPSENDSFEATVTGALISGTGNSCTTCTGAGNYVGEFAGQRK